MRHDRAKHSLPRKASSDANSRSEPQDGRLGAYYIKIINVDAFGAVTSVVQQAVVSRAVASVSVMIYNAAGEVVRHLYGQTSDPTGSEMSGVVLSSSVLAPAAGKGGPASVEIMVQSSSSPVTLLWDGTNDEGALVSPGHYLVAVQWADGKGGITDISQGVLVTGTQEMGWVSAQPNILHPSSGLATTTFYCQSAQSFTLRVHIYDVAGELVNGVEGAAGTNQALWNATGLASGLYLAAVDLVDANGGIAGRQILKIVVLH